MFIARLLEGVSGGLEDLLDYGVYLAVGLHGIVEAVEDDLRLNIAAPLVLLEMLIRDGMRQLIGRSTARHKVL